MGNSPSAEANRNAFLSDPSAQQQPHHHRHPIHVPSLHPPPPPEPSSNQNRLSKPRTRRQSTTGLSRAKPDGLANISISRPRRSLTLGASTSPLKAAHDDDQLLSSYPVPESPAMFTFEEAVVAVAGHRASGYWAPIAPAFDVDIQHLQEQQSRQQNAHQHDLSHPDDEEQLELKTPKHKSRKRDSILRSLSMHRPMRRHHEHQSSRRRNSIASEYPSDEWRPSDGDSTAYSQAAGEYYGSSAPANNWSPRADSHASWNYNLSSYEAKRLLHIVDGDNPVDYQLELTSAVSEGRVPALSGMRSPLPDPNRGESIIRVHSDLSLYAPMRRRSMLQIPGVATRVSTGGSAVGQPSFPQSLPGTPGLSHQASFESVQSCTLSTPPLPSLPPLVRPSFPARQQSEPAPRASTPCDNDYQAIGAFKLGTLRITNGIASPISSPERIKTGDDTEDLGGFNFAARTEALAILTGATRRQDNNGSKRISYDAFMNRESSDGGLRPLPSPMEQPLSPLTTTSVDSFCVPTSAKRTTAIELPQIELPDDIFDGFEFNLFVLDDAATTRATTQAPLSPGLQTTSKKTATEDKLFEDEDDSRSPEYVTSEVLDVRIDPNAKPTAIHPSMATATAKKKSTRSSRSMRSITRSDSGFVSSPASESSHHKPLSKADSGYSSNMSMRSFKHAAHKLMAPVAAVKAATLSPPERNGSSSARNSPQRESFYIGELKLPGPSLDADGSDLLSPMAALYSSDARYARPLPPLPRPLPSKKASPLPPIQTSLVAPRRQAPPPPPPKDLPPVPLTPSIPTTGQSSSSITPLRKLSRKRYTMSIALLGAQQSSNPVNDSSALATPRSVGSDGLDFTSSTGGKSTQKLGRLSRFFNLGAAAHHKELPPAPPTHVEEVVADVPSVPQEARGQPHDHLGMLPPPRRVALRTQLSRDTLKTIFSVGSLEARSALEPHVDVAARAPGPVAEEKKKEEGARHEHQSWRRRRYTLQSPPLSPVCAEASSWRTLTRRKSRLRPEGKEGGKGPETGRLLSTNNDVVRTASTSTSRPSSASRSAAKRAMSLTAQLEHGLNEKRSFSKSLHPPMADGQNADPPSLSGATNVKMPAEQYQFSAGAAETPADAWMTTQPQLRPQFLPSVPPSQQLQRPQTTPSSSSFWDSSALQYWASFENYGNQEMPGGNLANPQGGSDSGFGQQLQSSNMVHGYHHRNRSTGDRNGLQGPFRILHSYDSPAYRGVPIWG